MATGLPAAEVRALSAGQIEAAAQHAWLPIQLDRTLAVNDRLDLGATGLPDPGLQRLRVIETCRLPKRPIVWRQIEGRPPVFQSSIIVVVNQIVDPVGFYQGEEDVGVDGGLAWPRMWQHTLLEITAHRSTLSDRPPLHGRRGSAFQTLRSSKLPV